MKAESIYLPVCPESGDTGVAYLRVNIPCQQDANPLEIQREKVLALASSLGVTIAPDHVISEVASGIDPNRPGLQAVWNLVASKEVRYVFVCDAIRLGRDLQEVLRFVRHCKAHGVSLRFAEDCLSPHICAAADALN